MTAGLFLPQFAAINNFADGVNNSAAGSKIKVKCWQENDERASLFRNSQKPVNKTVDGKAR